MNRVGQTETSTSPSSGRTSTMRTVTRTSRRRSWAESIWWDGTTCALSCTMGRFRMVKIWFPQNTFFRWFFTWRAFIMVYYIIKLVLEFQFDLQNPLKLPKIRIFEKWKIIVFGQNYDIFLPKGGLKPCIIMYLGNIHNMSLVPVTFGNFFFQILQKWHFLG